MKLGLTGSIGMGKSTVAQFFADFGVDIWDADLVVKRLYNEDKGLLDLIQKISPNAIINDMIDRKILRKNILNNPEILTHLEAYIHPKVSIDREKFLAGNSPVMLCDIPLLFEKNMENQFDFVIVVSASNETQKSRVLARNSMSENDLKLILQKQMPNTQKRAKADFVIDTDTSLENTKSQVEKILKTIGAFHA